MGTFLDSWQTGTRLKIVLPFFAGNGGTSRGKTFVTRGVLY
jgi:hypothetical protein